MQTKLTLRLEEKLIEQAKVYAKHRGKSVSQIVADYFVLLNGDEQSRDDPELGPITQSLKGCLSGTDVDEKDYQEYLEEKYL